MLGVRVGLLGLVDLIENTEHLSLALVNPLIKQKIGNFHIFVLVFEATNSYDLDEVDPVGNALNQLVLLPEAFLLFENALLGLLKDIGEAVDLQSFPIQHMNDLFHKKFVLLFAPNILIFRIGSWSFLQA
jgi:hypothetical protein